MGIAKEMESTVDSHEVRCPKTEIGQATSVQPAYVPIPIASVIESFILEPSSTQGPCVAVWIAPAVEYSVDNHEIVYNPIPDYKRESRRESIVPSIYLGVNPCIEQ